jgi:hypothetical protein
MLVQVTKGRAAPITLTEFHKKHPQTSFPQEIPTALLAEYGVYPTVDMNRPTIDDNQRAERSNEFTQVDGKWVREWTVRALTKDEARAAAVAELVDDAERKRVEDLRNTVDTEFRDTKDAKGVWDKLAQLKAARVVAK